MPPKKPGTDAGTPPEETPPANEPTTTPDAPEPQATATKSTKSNEETVYSRADLMLAASAFGVTSDVMAGALRAAEIGEDGATKADVEKAVAAFSERKV